MTAPESPRSQPVPGEPRVPPRIRRGRFLSPAMWRGILGPTPRACWDRLRAGRGPFSPTLADRRPQLDRASTQGRALPGEPYLRPVPNCDCHAPEILAVADVLRRQASSDWAYAEAVYNFTTNAVVHAIERPPRGVVDTLRKGYGMCADKIFLFIALARAGGLPARCCRLRFEMNAELAGERAPWLQILSRLTEHLEARQDPRLERLATSWRTLTRLVQEALEARLLQSLAEGRSYAIGRDDGTHPIAEVKVGGVWIPVDPSTDDAECACYGLPLQRFGYVPAVLRMVHGSIKGRSETTSFGWRQHVARAVVCVLARGAVDYLNLSIEEARERGHKLLDEVGRAEYIGRHRRFYVPVDGLSGLGITLPPIPTA